MSVFLDDLLNLTQAQAYAYAAEVTRAERKGLRAQVRTDWVQIAPAALRVLDNLDTLGTHQQSSQLREPLEWLSGTPYAPAPGLTPAARDLAQTIGVTADAVSDASVRLQLTSDDAQATLAHLSTTLAAVARVGAAAASGRPAREGRDRSAERFDALVHACTAIARVDHAPAGGLIPAPGTLADAVTRWTTQSVTALSPSEVNGRTLRSVPADLRYLHAATAVLLNTDGHTAAQGASREGLADAEQAWEKVLQAWPPQMATQPGGRHNAEQLEAARVLHNALRPLRQGNGWADARQIQERIDVEDELRAIATLARTQIPTLGQAYATSVRTLIAEEVIAWPARHLPRPSIGNDPVTLQAAARGRWVPLPSDSAPAETLVRVSDAASLATTCAGAGLRPQAAPRGEAARRARRDTPRLSPLDRVPTIRLR